MSTKSPTSLPPAIKSPTKRIWYQRLARIAKMPFEGPSQDVSTLETLRLDLKKLCGGPHHRDLDLSRHESLQKIEITARSLLSASQDFAPKTVPGTLRAIISTINSPAFSDVVIIYGQDDFYYVEQCKSRSARSLFYCNEGLWYCTQFDVFREMYKARDYRLVLQAPCVGDISVRELERCVAVEKTKRGLPPRLEVKYTLVTH